MIGGIFFRVVQLDHKVGAARVEYRMVASSGVKELLALRVPPISIGVFNEPPPSVEPYAGDAVPSGCSFWATAQSGLTFYTAPEDHLRAVGSYTHNMAPSEAAPLDLQNTVEFMVENRYLREDDIPTIPTLKTSPSFVAYGPVDANAFAPDVVMVCAEPSRAMLLFEACVRAGAGDPSATLLGRPSCGAVPQAANTGRSAFSLASVIGPIPASPMPRCTSRRQVRVGRRSPKPWRRS
jgi:uncharacterized protein (DUF169 family)